MITVQQGGAVPSLVAALGVAGNGDTINVVPGSRPNIVGRSPSGDMTS